MSRQLNWFIGKQQKYDSFIIGQSKGKDKRMQTNTAVQPQYRYCKEKKGYCTNANWYGECSITACDKERLHRSIYGNTAKQVIIDERIE